MKAYASAALAVLLAAPCREAFQLHPAQRAVASPKIQGASTTTRLFSTLEDKTTKSKFDPADDFEKLDPSDALATEDEIEATPAKFLGDAVPYSELTVGVLKETYPGENRVSVAPESAKMLVDAGLTVVVESGGECA